MIRVPNKPLVPTRKGEAPLLAAQRQRWAVAQGQRMKSNGSHLRGPGNRYGARLQARVGHRNLFGRIVAGSSHGLAFKAQQLLSGSVWVAAFRA
jgi:hypothetical protein